MTNLAIGVDLGGTSIKAALINRDSGIVELRSSPTLAHEGPEKVIDRISTLIKDLSTEAVGGLVGGIGGAVASGNPASSLAIGAAVGAASSANPQNTTGRSIAAGVVASYV